MEENLDKNNDEIVSTFLESNYRKIIVKREQADISCPALAAFI